MQERKWEEMNMDCLVNVFGRVGMESLILDIPFVCKSWYKVTLNPLCWQRLVFPGSLSCDLWSFDIFISRLMDEYHMHELCVSAFIMNVVKRSCKSATLLAVPEECTGDELMCIADECPHLKTLILPRDLPLEHISKVPEVISKWKNLEGLRLGSSFKIQEVLAQISIHCNKFCALAVTRAYIGDDEVSALVTLVPNIKYLHLSRASITKENLVMILEGCKELRYVDVRNCIGFNEGDGEILKLTSGISIFKDEGSTLFDDDDYDDFRCSYREDGFHDGNVSD